MKSTLKESNIFLNDINESILPQTSPEVIFKLNELPEIKNPSHNLSGEISQYPPTPSRPRICLYGWSRGQ